MVGDPPSNRAAPLVLQTPRRLARGLEQKGVRARRVRAQQPVLPIVHQSVLANLGKIAAHQCEMVVAVGLPDVADALERRLVADMTAEGVARIRGVYDH